MSQLYYLKNGGIGHYCDVYEEEVVEKLGEMPKDKVMKYILDLKKNKGYYGNDNERLNKALDILESKNASVKEVNTALETVAQIEYSRRFSAEDSIIEKTEELIRKYRKEDI